MTADGRKTRLAELKDEILELETIEVRHIEAAMEQGTIIEHRGAVDLKALLGIVVVSKSKAQAA